MTANAHLTTTSPPTMTVEESNVTRYIKDPQTGGYLSKEEWEKKYGRDRMSTFTIQEGTVQKKLDTQIRRGRVVIAMGDESSFVRDAVKAFQDRNAPIIANNHGRSWDRFRDDPLSRKAMFKKGKR